jgi:DNA-binding transcriptional LysR family regulator
VTNTRPAAPGLVERDVGPIPHVVCASPAYFKQHGTPGEPQQLREHNCLVDSSADLRKWPFKKGGREIVVDVKGSLRIDDDDALSQIVLSGLGVAVLPTFIVGRELQSGRLRSVLADYVPLERTIYSVRLPNVRLPVKVRGFIDFLQARFGPIPYWERPDPWPAS